jgi:hypothetical protein
MVVNVDVVGKTELNFFQFTTSIKMELTIDGNLSWVRVIVSTLG